MIVVVVVVVFYFYFQFYMQLIFDHIQPDLFDIVFDNDVLSKKEFEKKISHSIQLTFSSR
jgi:hypothetical protein